MRGWRGSTPTRGAARPGVSARGGVGPPRHRIGRTGRAEKEGDAFTILSADELMSAEAVERFIGQTVPRRRLENFEYLYTTLLDDSRAAQQHLRTNLSRSRSKSRRR